MKWNYREKKQISFVYIDETNNPPVHPGSRQHKFQVEFGQSLEHQEMMGFVSRLVDFPRGPSKGRRIIQSKPNPSHHFSLT